MLRASDTNKTVVYHIVHMPSFGSIGYNSGSVVNDFQTSLKSFTQKDIDEGTTNT